MSESNREEIGAAQNAASAAAVHLEASHTAEASIATPVNSTAKAHEFNEQTNYVSKSKIITVGCLRSDEFCFLVHPPVD